MKASKIDISEAKTIEEVLDLANGNWVAQEQEIMTQTGLSIDTHKSLVKSSDNSILGVVGSNYAPINNSTAFALFDTVVKQSKGQFTNYHEINNGSRVIVEATLGKFEAKVGDIVEKRVKMINSFNGTNPFTISFEGYRLVCENGMTRAEKSACIKVRHTKNHDNKIQEALRVLGYADHSYERFQDQCQVLAQKTLNVAMVDQFLKDLYKINENEKESKQFTKKRDTILDLFENGKGNKGETAWDLYNGVTEYYDHFQGNNKEKSLASNLVGNNSKFKANALNLALAM